MWLALIKVLVLGNQYIKAAKNLFVLNVKSMRVFELPVQSTEAKTQHCPYLTGFNVWKYFSIIGTEPVHAAGAVPSEYWLSHRPTKIPLSSLELTYQNNVTSLTT